MMAVACFWRSVYETTGRHIALPWELVEGRITNPKPAHAKDGLPRWALAEYRGGKRNLASFLRGHACMFDVDDGTTLAQLEKALTGSYAIIHSTFSATEAEPCWRVIAPHDRPTTNVDEQNRVWRFDAAKIEAVGGRPEYSARSAAQPFAVPCRPPSGYYVSRVLRGAFTSVSEALSIIPKPEPLPVAECEPDDSYDSRLRRAGAYLSTMDPAVSGSGGHTTTMRAAVAMVRGFALQPADALRLLATEFNERCQPRWTQRELAHKCKQAYQRGKMPFAALAEKRAA
jgi:hypothetical protein